MDISELILIPVQELIIITDNSEENIGGKHI